MSGWIVYSKDGSLERCKLRSLEYGGTAMGERAVTATFDYHSEVAFEVFDYIEYRGERFELEAVPTVKKLSSFEYQYELRFVSLKYELERCEMRDLVPSDNGVVYPTPLTFSFTGDVRYLTDRIQACLDAMYGAGVWKITIAEGTSSEEKNITIAQQNCWNALALVNSTYGLNFYIKGRTITIGGEQPLVSHTFEYGKGNGLYEIERASDTETGIVTKLRAYGSTRNLDYSYPKKPEWSDSVLPVSFALSPLRLMLPSFKTDGKTDYVLADDAAIAKYGIREASMVYDDIYPSIAGATYNGQAIDEIKSVDAVDESQKTFVVYFHDLGFDLEEHLTTSDAQISMKSGALQGYTFTISSIEKQTGGYKITLGKNSLENSEESGAYVPGVNWNMKAGDKFVLLNILMPQKYIRDAENRLLARANEYLAQYSKTNFSYNIGLHDKFLIQNPSVYDSLIEGSKLKVYDKEIGIDEEVTIQSITITENLEGNILPQVKVTLNNEPSASTLDRIQGKLNEVAAETAANGFTTQSEIMAQYRRKLDKPFFDKLFVAIDANGNEIPSTDVITPIAYIKAKYHVASVGGFTMYAMGKDVDVPSLASGLPFDGRTIWYNPETQQIEVIGGTGGGSGEGVSNFWDLSGIPSWITNSKPKYTYSEIEGTPDLSKYALVSQIPSLDGYAKLTDIPSLSGYATESWVLGKGYATTSDLDGRINALINGAPAAYDTLKEIADVLAGNVDSIGDIIIALGTKADKATTLSGYGITDAYTKSSVDSLLNGYVTIKGNEDVTGIHNFVNGIKVGGIVLKKSDDGIVYIDGNLVVKGGVTMYGDEKADIPSIYDGLPIDNVTIYWENTSGGKVLKAKVGTEGAITEVTSAMVIAALGFTPYDSSNPNGYITSSSLNGYATQTWVKNQGYLTSHQDLSGYQPLITSSNKLAYSLISGTPTSLKNPNALSFGSKTYDGSAKITLTATDLGALTSHQTIYTLTFQSGTFASGSFTANSANKTINIPTTTSHISEGTNLYFTNARAVSALTDTLKAYVTLSGEQTISGKKNFTTGGLFVNGSQIKYDATKKYWKLEGDLLVTGGVTMYGSDSSFVPSTIMDAIAVDGTTISKDGGVLKVIGGTGGGVADSVAWANITGKPSWIGSSKPTYSYSEITGAISTTELQNYLTSNSYLNVTSGDNRYLMLSGGTISGNYGALTIHRTDAKPSLIKYSNSSNNLGYLGVDSSKNPVFYKGSDAGTPYTIWHTGNDGEGSGLDADLLDGVQLSGLLTSLSSSSETNLSITIGGTTKSISNLVSHRTNFFNSKWSYSSGEIFDLNEWDTGGIVRCYGNSVNLLNKPSGFSFGSILSLSEGTKALTGQLAWDINSGSTSDTTRRMWFRVGDSSNGFTYAKWHQIAFTDSNVASATKLETARTIWGKNFDGTADINGKMTFTTKTLSRSAINYSGDSLIFSDDNAETLIRGTAIKFQNATGTNAMILSEGNLGIGVTAPEYRLHVKQNTDSAWASLFQTPNSKVYLAQSSGRGIYAGVLSGVSTTYLLNLKYNQTTLGNGGSSALYVRTDGYIGIGTENPDYNLHVIGTTHINGDTSFNSSVTIKGTGSTTARIIMSRSSYNYINYPADGSLCLGTSNATASTQLFIDGATGNVGIGTTSPSYKLHVIGDIGNENVSLRYSTSNPFLSLVRSTSSETWYVQAVSGYLAIGRTSSASCKIDASGNFLSPAGITMYSDQRKKTILNHVELSLKDIANAPLIEHYYNSDEKKTTHVGSIAQYWASFNDWFCKLDNEGYYTMEIQNAALASAISIARELDRYETKTDKAIKKLKKRICELEEEVERLKSA